MREHEKYCEHRQCRRLQPLSLIQVRMGTFDKVKELIMRDNPSTCSMQYKLPRIMRREHILKYLLSRSVNTSVCNNNDTGFAINCESQEPLCIGSDMQNN